MTIESLMVTQPIPITDTNLYSSDLTEEDYAAWSSATTYALGDRVILTSTHKIYESVQAANINKDPVVEFAWWVEVSSTNKWKCFDTSNSTATVANTSCQYVFNINLAVTSLGLLNLTQVSTLRVRVSDTGYDKTAYLDKILADASWYSFFIANKLNATSAVLNDLDASTGSHITVDIVGSSSLSFGVLLLGQAKSIGRGVNYGVRVGIQDYSRKVTNDWGDTILVKRAYAKRATFTVRLSRQQVDATNDFLVQLRATPSLWVASTLYTTLVIFGIYESFDTTIQYYDYSECSLNLLGLT